MFTTSTVCTAYGALQTLSEPFYTDRKGEIPEGKKGYYQMPIVHNHDGLVTINYGGEFIQVSPVGICQASHPCYTA